MLPRAAFITAAVLAATLTWPPAPAFAQTRPVDHLIVELNEHATVKGTESSKSYKIVFDAYLDGVESPFPIGPEFNHITIHPDMADWASVSSWAESNHGLADAIIEARDRKIIGLPYGKDNVPPRYQDAGVMVEFVPEGRMRIDFAYLDDLDVIAAFAVAEVYRRMEAGQTEDGLKLAMAHLVMLRHFCDRDFLTEKAYSIQLLTEAIANLRDVFLLYQDDITAEQFTNIAWWEMPYLRPDRNRLFMPEADRKVANTLLNNVFDAGSGDVKPDRLVETFAEIQAGDQPLTQFGAARRWQWIAEVHGSLDASQERLTLIYDDWWRRWRVQEYDQILDIPSQFERTNEIRYAAVIHSLEDLRSLFPLRNQLMAEVFGTAMVAGLNAYRATYGSFPNDAEKIYAQFVRKICDFDPFDQQFDPFRYRRLDQRATIDTPDGRLELDAGDCLLYSLGQNHDDDRGAEHSDDGFIGDLVLWPPIRATSRKAGLID